jgi:hypothetical protein
MIVINIFSLFSLTAKGTLKAVINKNAMNTEIKKSMEAKLTIEGQFLIITNRSMARASV